MAQQSAVIIPSAGKLGGPAKRQYPGGMASDDLAVETTVDISAGAPGKVALLPSTHTRGSPHKASIGG